MDKNLANYFTWSRIIFSPLLIIPLYLDNTFAYCILMLSLAFTDFMDGYLSRKYKIESKKGRLLDSVADIILSLFMLVGFVRFFQSEMRENIFLTISIVFWVLFPWIASFVKFRAAQELHLASGKFTFAFAFFAFTIMLIYGFNIWLYRLVGVFIFVSGVDCLLFFLKAKSTKDFSALISIDLYKNNYIEEKYYKDGIGNFLRPIFDFLPKLILNKNAFTFVSFSFGLLASTQLFSNLSFYGLFILLHTLFDILDGQVARYKKLTSKTGYYLDKISDTSVNLLVLASVYLNTHDPIAVLCIFALLVHITFAPKSWETFFSPGILIPKILFIFGQYQTGLILGLAHTVWSIGMWITFKQNNHKITKVTNNG